MSEFVASTFVLSVCDLASSKAFYTEKLGFTEDFSVNGWAFLSRGACHLRIGDCPGSVPMSQCPDHSWMAYLHVKGAEDLFREFLQKAVTIWHPLQDKPWGFREFGIVTPDGHRIVFGEELTKEEVEVDR